MLTLRPVRECTSPPGWACVHVVYKHGYDLDSINYCRFLFTWTQIWKYLDIWNCIDSDTTITSTLSPVEEALFMWQALEVVPPSTVTKSLQSRCWSSGDYNNHPTIDHIWQISKEVPRAVTFQHETRLETGLSQPGVRLPVQTLWWGEKGKPPETDRGIFQEVLIFFIFKKILLTPLKAKKTVMKLGKRILLLDKDTRFLKLSSFSLCKDLILLTHPECSWTVGTAGMWALAGDRKQSFCFDLTA